MKLDTMDRKRDFLSVVKKLLRNFFLPEINRKLLIRLVVISGICLLFFLFFKPCFSSGSSMEPAWHDNGFTLSFRWKYLYSYPQRGDVVTISYFGRRELLKRVVALPGDRVQFRGGILFVNDTAREEPYVVFPCDWESEPLVVRDGHCFVVGDNRSQTQAEHIHGEVELDRISGGVLF